MARSAWWARLAGELITIVVRNPVAARESEHEGNRVALANVRERLALLYGELALVKAGRFDEEYIVTLRFPHVSASREGLSLPMLKVLIVDDEPPARERLRSLLAEIGDSEIVGEAGNGARGAEPGRPRSRRMWCCSMSACPGWTASRRPGT